MPINYYSLLGVNIVYIYGVCVLKMIKVICSLVKFKFFLLSPLTMQLYALDA